MTAAVLAALAAWCAVPASASARCRALYVRSPARSRPDPGILAAVMVLPGALALFGWPFGIVLGIAAAPFVRRAVGRLESTAHRRRAALTVAQLPASLDLMVAALEVGRPPVAAFALAAEATAEPLGPELGRVASRLAVAGDAHTVWLTVAADPVLAPVGRAFRRAEASGMPVAGIISGVADELRREGRARRREHSRKVAVRTAAPLGACFLPAFFLIGIVPTIIATFRTFSL